VRASLNRQTWARQDLRGFCAFRGETVAETRVAHQQTGASLFGFFIDYHGHHFAMFLKNLKNMN
jgi:hypothetical protein